MEFSVSNHIQNSVQSLGVFKPAVEVLQCHMFFIIFIFISPFLEFASRKETFDTEIKKISFVSQFPESYTLSPLFHPDLDPLLRLRLLEGQSVFLLC